MCSSNVRGYGTKTDEQTIQMAEFKKEKTTDKTELKKNAVPMADFRTILLKSKIHPAATPVSPVAFPTFIFTFERREVFLKLFIYHGVKKEFQFWYFQIRINCKWISPIYRRETGFFKIKIN